LKGGLARQGGWVGWAALAVLTLPALRLFGQQATLLGDAHVSSLRPTVNAGSLSNLDVGNGATALLQFDLGVLPAGTTASQITRATLRVYCNRIDAPGLVTAQPITGSWSESAVTYATLPAIGTAVQTASVASEGAYVTFDITATVQNWITFPNTNQGIALTATTAVLQFDSKENDQTGHAPELDIALAAGSTSGTIGATGATGTMGATGATGAIGPAGFNGATGAMGATGSAGVTGPTGAQGQAGGAGLIGYTGATGTNGAAGVTGATGTPGLVYQGTYSSVSNYALGDVVVFAGSSYASLTAANHGQTPSLSPTYWGLLTAIGATGSTGGTGAAGPTGSQGLLGPVGPPGEQGSQGQQGIAGQAGAQGIQGISGVTGPTGAQGIIGPAGPVGLTWKGPYDSTANYALNDGVVWQGASYISLNAANHGNTPSLSPASWAIFAAAGSTGSQGGVGATGSTGSIGATGAAGLSGINGATGITGATGSAGLTYQGTYSSINAYNVGDVVVFNGATWVSIQPANHGQTPNVSPTWWGIVASEGAMGLVGPTGSIGTTGPQGLQGVAGPVGATGLQGASGPQGPAGAQGVTGAAGSAGAQGPAGIQGPAGQAGAQGIQGIAGSTGATGNQGATGAAGAIGLTWQGPYSATNNYAVNDAVAWQGASWISLTAANHGNAPDQSPAAWSLIAARGATGLPGTTGSQGQQGPVGATGATGAAGSTGVAGVTGSIGATGLNFTGDYAPTISYNSGDAVSYAGSTWVSLIPANHGQTPGVSPTAWVQLAAQGLTGATGPAGATGLAGGTGSTGATGVTGSQGAPIHFLGGWLAATSYALGDTVSYGGSSYIAIAANTSREPDQSPVYWAVLAAQGSSGSTGPIGSTGPAGSTGGVGPAGPVGSTGAQGIAGPIGPTGSVGATGGAGPAGPTGTTGPQGQQGVVGPAGATGPAGPPGTQGPAGSQGVTGAAGPVGAQGYTGSQGPAGQAGAQGIQGIAGATGAQGPAGPAGSNGATGPSGSTGSAGAVGINFRSAWNATNVYAVNDAVTYSGSTYLALSASTNLEPDLYAQSWILIAAVGGAGPTGAAGTAATVSVGTVTTLAAGSSATVTNTGTTQSAILNFGIPQGAQGAAGTGGSGGSTASNSSFAAVYHAVSFATQYYSPNAPTASASETAAILAWVPNACTATQLSVFSQQSNAIVATVRNGTPGSMANTALTCSPATNGSCTSTGSVSIAAGSFLDIEITGASGTSAGVWTAIQCQ
jgi:hypothetical protein